MERLKIANLFAFSAILQRFRAFSLIFFLEVAQKKPVIYQ